MRMWFGDSGESSLVDLLFDPDSQLNELPELIDIMREFTTTDLYPSLPATAITTLGYQARMMGEEIEVKVNIGDVFQNVEFVLKVK